MILTTTIRLITSLLALSALSTTSCQKEENAVRWEPDSSIEAKVTALLSEMTIDEKIGQMTQADRGALGNIQDIKEFHLGSLLSGGGSAPSDNTPAGWADMYDRFQSYALQTRLKIPLIYGIDAVHGHNNVRGAVIFPHNIGLGCTNNPAIVEEVERVTAKEVAGTGIDWTFAPCIAVPRDERWGRTYEGFSESPDPTKLMTAAAVKGFQGSSLGDGGSILACAKHFLGDGGTTDGRDQGNTQVDEQTMRALHLPGYIAAINAGVGSIMVSYSSWNGVKMHGSSYWITDVLKGELAFKGFVVSDWAGIDQLPGDYASDVAMAINAGIDMVMVPTKYKEFITTLRTLVNQGRVPLLRIDDAVRRILRKKFELGIFDRPLTDRTLTLSIGSPEHRAVAREAVRQSVVLLKNENKTLPLSKNISHIHVAGKSADDLGNQCGGWTISWSGNSGPITTGTTFLQALKNSVSPATKVTYSRDGTGATGAVIGIAVVGETPYAEGQGDRWDLSLSAEDVACVARLRATGIPVVTILISGRPMIIETALGISDAFIAAWLPGTEGQGVADVVLGDYNPTGKLSHSWPRTMSQIPINVGDQSYTPLFPFGYGLSYER
ncbi:MAG TPA: beta-glucosidase [Bacteroidetes bacterium]|nr:beta-glucosidase [Bacteroidota bacterium]